MTGYVVLALLSGMCFSLVGFAYRLGGPRNIPVTQILAVLAVAGTAAFVVGCRDMDLSLVPERVWVWGIVAGLSQYALAKVIGVALRMGPLSPLWCAVSVAFLPTVGYAHFCGEPIGTWQILGIISAVGCVLAASKAQNGSAPGPKRALPTMMGLAYAGVLLGALLLNSVSGIATKDLQLNPAAAGRTGSQPFQVQEAQVTNLCYQGDMLTAYGGMYYTLFYGAIAVPALIETFFRRRLVKRVGLLLGVMAAVGSVVGMRVLWASLGMSAAVVYTLNGVSGIMTTALVSPLVFAEKTTRAWFVSIALGVAAVVLTYL